MRHLRMGEIRAPVEVAANISVFIRLHVPGKARIGVVQHGEGTVGVSGRHLVCEAFMEVIPGVENQELPIMTDRGILIYGAAVLIYARHRADVG